MAAAHPRVAANLARQVDTNYYNRMEHEDVLNAVNQENLYTPGHEGYTDYPTYQKAAA